MPTIDYNEDTCPNPQTIYEAGFKQMGEAVNALVTRKNAETVAVVDANAKEIEAVKSLLNKKASADNLAKVAELIASIDVNGDGQIFDDVQNIVDLAAAAQTAAENAQKTANEALTLGNNNKTAIDALGKKMSEVETSASSNADKIKTLTEAFNAFNNWTEAQIRGFANEEAKQLICANNLAWVGGVGAGVQAFIEAVNEATTTTGGDVG